MTDKKFKKMDKVYIFNKSQNPDPEYKTLKAAGFDIASNEDSVLEPNQVKLIGTGLHFVLMPGYEAQIRLRSSWGLKGLMIPNAPGTIDEDYRGEIKVMLCNLNPYPIKINKGERIAQVVCAQSLRPKIYIMDSDEWNSPQYQTLRGEGGFGSTGDK
jgi:dUTP pyrophosphatase